MVFGRGRNPINFVSARDVAALVERAVLDSSLRGEILEIGGPTNVAMSDFVHVLEQVLGASRRPRRIPRPLLKFMGALLRPIKPDLARQVRAAFAMDVLDMTFDGDRIRRRFPDLPETPLRQGVEDYWRAA